MVRISSALILCRFEHWVLNEAVQTTGFRRSSSIRRMKLLAVTIQLRNKATVWEWLF